MPIYEYRCEACKKAFETIVLRVPAAGEAAQKATCPKCGSTSTERLASRFAMSGTTRKSEGSEDWTGPGGDFGGGFGEDEFGDDAIGGGGVGGGFGGGLGGPGGGDFDEELGGGGVGGGFGEGGDDGDFDGDDPAADDGEFGGEEDD